MGSGFQVERKGCDLCGVWWLVWASGKSAVGMHARSVAALYPCAPNSLFCSRVQLRARRKSSSGCAMAPARGKNHVPQKRNGQKRPASHSGKRKPASEWLAIVAEEKANAKKSIDELLKAKEELEGQLSRAQSTKKDQENSVGELEQLKTSLARANLENMRLKTEKKELSASLDQLEQDNGRLQAANAHLSSVVQQLTLDLEWCTGSTKHRGMAPTLLRRKYGQRSGSISP